MRFKGRKGLYPKERPRDRGQYDWYTKVKVGGKWQTISLRLKANDGGREINIKEAEARRDAIKTEALAGKLASVLAGWTPSRSIDSAGR